MKLHTFLRAGAAASVVVALCAEAQAGELTIKGKVVYEAVDAAGKPANKPGFAAKVKPAGKGITGAQVATNGAGAFTVVAQCAAENDGKLILLVDGVDSFPIEIKAADCAAGKMITLTEDLVVGRCPCVPGPYPKPEVRIDVLEDPVNKNQFGLACTNQAATGDFVRSFKDVANGAAGLKAIGKCQFVGGLNDAFPINTPGAKSIAVFIHVNTDDDTVDNANCQRIAWRFDVAKCELLRIRMKREVNMGVTTYTEVAPRKTIKKADFMNFANFAANVSALVAGVFDAPPAPAPPPPAPGAAAAADRDGGGDPVTSGCGPSRSGDRLQRRTCEGKIRWNTGGFPMNFDPGDRIIIEGLSAVSVFSVDSRFTAQDSPDGLVLTSIADFVPDNGAELLSFDTLLDVLPGSSAYLIEDISATPFWDLVAAGEPIVGYNPDDAPDSATGMGVLDLFGTGLLGDVSADGVVNTDDLNMVLGNFGCAGTGDCTGDADGDGDSDSIDLNIILGNWNDQCIAPE